MISLPKEDRVIPGDDETLSSICRTYIRDAKALFCGTFHESVSCRCEDLALSKWFQYNRGIPHSQ